MHSNILMSSTHVRLIARKYLIFDRYSDAFGPLFRHSTDGRKRGMQPFLRLIDCVTYPQFLTIMMMMMPMGYGGNCEGKAFQSASIPEAGRVCKSVEY